MKFSRIPIRFSRRAITMAAGVGAASALAMGAAGAATSSPEVTASASLSSAPFVFQLQQSPNIASCLPHAGGTVAIFPHKLNDTMVVPDRVLGIKGDPQAALDLDVHVRLLVGAGRDVQAETAVKGQRRGHVRDHQLDE